MKNFDKALAEMSSNDENTHGNDFYRSTEKGQEVVRLVQAGLGAGKSLNTIADILNRAGYTKCWYPWNPHNYQSVRYIAKCVIGTERRRERLI